MNLNDQDRAEIRQLEESLWRKETRFDRDFQEKVFAHDFVEFGRSGRSYTRAEMIRTEAQDIQATLPLKNLVIRSLDQFTVLVTYQSEVLYETLERSNRSSIWSRTSQGWQLRFHQGTPTI